MGLAIESGTGNGKLWEINNDNHGVVKAIVEVQEAHISHHDGLAYSVTVEDAGPAAGEYTLYIQNTNSSLNLVLTTIRASNVDANVVWKIHNVTGTAAGTILTPVNMNFESGNIAAANCRGGAGGVTGLTSGAVIHEWFGGPAYNSQIVEFNGALILPYGDAIAVEFDAGTGGKVAVCAHFHFIGD